MLNNQSKVYIGKVNLESKDLSSVIKNALDTFNDYLIKILDEKSSNLILKPNILPTEFRNEGLGVTNPRLCACIADYLKDLGFKRLILAEGTTNNRNGEPDTLEAMKNNGYLEFGDKWESFDMNKDEVGGWFVIYSPGDEGNPDDPFDIEIGISKIALKYPIISIAKFKTHDVLGLTLSIKNLMGCLCKARRKSSGEILHIGPLVKAYMHGHGPKNPYFLAEEQNITTSKVALAINLNRMTKILFPIFSILDAFPAMEGQGPLRGVANDMDLIMCSNDSVALDSIACNLVGLDLDYNQYIKQFERLNLGTTDYLNINIINRTIFEKTKKKLNFQFHERFQYSKFTPEEVKLLSELT